MYYVTPNQNIPQTKLLSKVHSTVLAFVTNVTHYKCCVLYPTIIW